MRTIKFRGKRLDNGLWVDGDLITSLTPQGSMTKCPAINTTYGTIGTFFVQPETIGQYTGLHDKNGKEIYEGDILVLSGKNCHRDTIIVEHGLYGWTFYNPKTAIFYEDGSHTYSAIENCRFMFGTGETIGNIHDNPELLEDCGNSKKGGRR